MGNLKQTDRDCAGTLMTFGLHPGSLSQVRYEASGRRVAGPGCPAWHDVAAAVGEPRDGLRTGRI